MHTNIHINTCTYTHTHTHAHTHTHTHTQVGGGGRQVRDGLLRRLDRALGHTDQRTRGTSLQHGASATRTRDLYSPPIPLSPRLSYSNARRSLEAQALPLSATPATPAAPSGTGSPKLNSRTLLSPYSRTTANARAAQQSRQKVRQWNSATVNPDLRNRARERGAKNGREQRPEREGREQSENAEKGEKKKDIPGVLRPSASSAMLRPPALKGMGPRSYTQPTL
jgi:hypothetical protein